ncbi:SRPBCC domain-containing protein [Acuticoccus sp.]|uniref:SRPBCC domain-containing protein n=1 Tax=Acuticoccus sp. TaxID=1904378 RepID=UPI003B51581E
MELSGEKVVKAPQAQVHAALHDATVLRRALPGLRSLAKVDAHRSRILAALKVGPQRLALDATVEVYNEDGSAGYSLRMQVDAGSAGSATGNAHVALAAIDAGATNLAYHVTAELAGELAALDVKRRDALARTLATEFFSRLEASMATAPAPPPSVQGSATKEPARAVVALADAARAGEGRREEPPIEPRRGPVRPDAAPEHRRPEPLGADEADVPALERPSTVPPGAVVPAGRRGIGRWIGVAVGLALIAALLADGF